MLPGTNTIGLPFIELRSIDSTNNYAMGLINAGMAQHGTTVFTHHQIKGKGQRGKQWLSEADQNIAISIIVAGEALQLHHLFLFNMAVALGVRRFFETYAKEKIKIKWPNDIYWNDRKAGGILIENIIKGQIWKYAVAGIGLNINQTGFDASLTKAVSLKQITGYNYDITVLAKELCSHVNLYYNLFMRDADSLFAEYQQHLYKLNETVQLRKGYELLEVVVKGVNKEGGLIIEGAAQATFNWGEVAWLL